MVKWFVEVNAKNAINFRLFGVARLGFGYWLLMSGSSFSVNRNACCVYRGLVQDSKFLAKEFWAIYLPGGRKKMCAKSL
jgi:hypothetical protein